MGERGAEYEQQPGKLLVTPSRAPPAGARTSVRVRYRAGPRKLSLPHNGRVPTHSGFATVPRPDLARTVFPCNDHPSDKADFTVRVTAPDGLTGGAAGSLIATRKRGDGTTTWTYRSKHPVATEPVQVPVAARRGAGPGRSAGEPGGGPEAGRAAAPVP